MTNMQSTLNGRMNRRLVILITTIILSVQAVSAQDVADWQVKVDFVNWHDYATGNAETPDEKVLWRATGPKRYANGARKLQAVMDSLQCGKRPLFMDEFHINYHPGDPKDLRTATQFSAVFIASVLADMSNSPVNRTFIHDVIARLYGLLGPLANDKAAEETGVFTDKTNPDAIHVRPSAWVHRWFNQYAGGQWVHCDVKIPDADKTSERGPLLDVCAWRNGNNRVVLLVNKDLSPHKVTINLGGEIPSDGFTLPLRIMTIADGRPCEMRTVGTKNGLVTRTLPAMSVTFLVREETTKEVDAP